MADKPDIVLVLPRMTRWMKVLSIYTAAVWLLLMFVSTALHGSVALGPLGHLVFIGARVIPGLELWRMVTYVLLEDPSTSGAIWSIVAFWLIGSPVEQAVGPRRVLQLVLAGALGGSVLALIATRLSIVWFIEPVVGTSAVAGAFLAAWGFVAGDQKASVFPGTPAMKGKHIALGFAAVSVVMAVFAHSVASIASVGGIVGGALWMLVVRRLRPPRERAGGRRRTATGERLRAIPGGKHSGGGSGGMLN